MEASKPEVKPDIMSIINGLRDPNCCAGCPYSSFEYVEDGSGSVYECALKNHSPSWQPHARLPHRPTGCMNMVEKWLLGEIERLKTLADHLKLELDAERLREGGHRC